MRESFTFTIPGKPTPWKRSGRNGRATYSTQTSKKRDIGTLANAAMSAAGLRCVAKDVPVAMTVYAVFKLPQRIPKGDTRRMGSKHLLTPDADNITKLIKDALNGVAYADDCQVFQINCEKVWSDYSMTRVTVEYL